MLDWGGASAIVPVTDVQLGHLGCKLLSTIEKIPADLASQWDRELGREWRDKKISKAKLSLALEAAVRSSGQRGAVLWDTMRVGSDYWRPGKLLLDVAENLPVEVSVSYAREDFLCPPRELLGEFMHTEMPFGEYAKRYAEHLKTGSRLQIAVAHVLLALARKLLPVFYCIDPYIPGYADRRETFSEIAYEHRYWLAALPKEACHRVVLAEEIAMRFASMGIPVHVFAVDPTFRTCHRLHCDSPAVELDGR